MNKKFDACAEDVLRATSDIIKDHGPRVSGSRGNKDAVEDLFARLGRHCTKIAKERFWIHANSLFAIGKVFASIYVIGILSIFINAPFGLEIGYIAMLSGTVFCAAQFILYLDSFDRLFGRVEGNNIVGSIEPKAPAKQQVLLVAHHDSSPVYPFYEKFPSLFSIRLIAPIVLFLFCHLVLLYASCVALLSGSAPAFPDWIKYLLFLGLVFVLPMYGYFSKKGAPGAGDNLIGCTICVKLAELFRSAPDALKNTRVIVLLTDGEEVGQKGAKHFIANNEALLKETKTSVVNIDSIYDYKDISLVDRDRNGFTRLSNDLADRMRTVALECGHSPKIIAIPFGGGGTDGGQFGRKNIETVSIIGMPTALVRKEILFHTMKDTPDKIAKEAVSAVIEIAYEYIRSVDSPLCQTSRSPSL